MVFIMNNKNNTRIIAIICFGTIAIFSILVFPFILAASPGNLDIRLIEMEDFLSTGNPAPVVNNGSENVTEPEPFNTNNLITKEQAIELAWKTFPYRTGVETTPEGGIYAYHTEFIDARCIENTDPESDPSWFLLFLSGFRQVSYLLIPEGYTQDEYLSKIAGEDFLALVNLTAETDDSGNLMVNWEFYGSQYEMIELNAVTGEQIGSGSNIPIYMNRLYEFTHWDDIKRNMDYWYTITKTEYGEIIREPLYHVEYDYGG